MGIGTLAAIILCASAVAAPPNIVVLISDDQRWDAMGCAGNGSIHTPNLDWLAANGTRFSNAFATTSICCTSRVSILSGMYARTHGIDDFATPMPAGLWEQSYPMLLRQAGYYTGFVGKWGIGGEMPTDDYDVFRGFSGQGKYFNEVGDETLHMTTLLEGQARDFIESAPADKPFCLSLSFKAPHVQDNDPRQFLYDPTLEDHYAEDQLPIPRASTTEAYDAMPEFIRASEGRVRWERRFANPEMHQRSLRGYYRLVTGIDRAMGRIMESLKATGRSENTVILFASDHGFFLGEYGLAGKWLMHDPSIRIPFLLYDPRIPKRDRVGRRNEIVLTIDIAPTVLALAGVAAPANLQGRDLSPLLRPGDFAWRSEFFYEHHFGANRAVPIPASEGVRTARWKYTRYVDRDPPYEEVYDLENDPAELTNLAPDHANLPALRKSWETWRQSLAPWDSPRALEWKEPQ